ncbi:RNA polymerase sigma factor [Roseiterribacter gracilis]|uniref:DNA-directed RNA polymerase sigma-70 factor n=1 Tax=Roseiterribacter gracilis TaxID=2812848 RepID=A0A8S8XAR4_9PROT|nr:DNA-directed RNA polymerase sigma-70 factor [Rhodospirillales bacterium TMPK1]
MGLMRAEFPSMATLYRRHAAEIRAYLQSRLGCRATADDLTQDAFLRLALADLGSVQDVRSYLYRVASNLLIDHHRHARRKHAPTELRELDECHDLASSEPDPEQMLVWRDEVRQLQRGVGVLSPLCQNIFWLSRAEGFRNAEIAKMLGVCVSTVEKNIGRAERHCRAMQPA